MTAKKRNYKQRTKTPNRNRIQSESSHAGPKDERSVLISEYSFSNSASVTIIPAIIGLIVAQMNGLLDPLIHCSDGLYAFLAVSLLFLITVAALISLFAISKILWSKQPTPSKEQCEIILKIKNGACSFIFCIIIFIAIPFSLSTVTRIQKKLVTVFPSAVSDSNADQGENGTNTITVTPTPSPELAPSPTAIATYTPIPKDECQQSFDRLWSFYMADFINNGPHKLEDAEATADALIDSIWLTTNTDSIDWNYEQMDLYSDSAYATALQDEQYLRQNSTAENKLIAAKEYVSATNTQIAQKSDSDNFQERDLGLAALRGVNLLSDYLSPSRPNAKDSADQENSVLTSGLQVGVAYNNMALLLRHFADNLYTDYESNIDSQKCQYALCVFSYACYKRAKSNGYNSQSIENDIAEMKKSLELVYPY